MNTLTSYQNGNCSIELFTDGTKIRSWQDQPKPLFPESVDCKITNYCDAGCPYCHEKSTKRGEHSSVETLAQIVNTLKPGTEIAIGGGNPLSHPNLLYFLRRLKDKNVIANMTVNSLHLKSYERFITYCRDNELIYGLGISYNAKYHNDVRSMIDPNTILHMITGVDSIHKIRSFPNKTKLLILGYKNFGFGERYNDKHDVLSKLKEWRAWIPSIIRQHHVSFDNLALRQLKIRELIGEKMWSDLYMGDDGDYTMYIDAVKKHYAVSSTASKRFDLTSSIEDMFKIVHQNKLTGINIL